MEKMLPDLGDHLRGLSSRQFADINGPIGIVGISRLSEDEFTVGAQLDTGNRESAASLDFGLGVWRGFADSLMETFALNLSAIQTSTEPRTVVLDAPLPTDVAMTVAIGAPTHSTKTGERFTPLNVTNTERARLIPSDGDILVRHEWWSSESTRRLREVGPNCWALTRTISQGADDQAKLDASGFRRNVSSAFLIRHLLEDAEPLEVLRFMAQNDLIAHESIDRAAEASRLVSC